MHHHKLKELFQEKFQPSVCELQKLPGAGSNREYFRIISDVLPSTIGVYGENEKENSTFIYFTNIFFSLGLPVPKCVYVPNHANYYFLQDLGSTSLYDMLKMEGEVSANSNIAILYKKTIEELLKFQVDGGNKIDFSNCFVRAHFDSQVFQWDLNYFKYYFLKLKGVVFDEQKLENDFTTLINRLSTIPSNYFLYRDFQSRNIMVHEGRPYFIDYQGGMRGPLQYDLASLLYQSRANLPNWFKEQMIDYYYDKLSRIVQYDKGEFYADFKLLLFLRTLQTLGAYGLRGLIEGKQMFAESIPQTVVNVQNLVGELTEIIDLPALFSSIQSLNK